MSQSDPPGRSTVTAPARGIPRAVPDACDHAIDHVLAVRPSDARTTDGSTR